MVFRSFFNYINQLLTENDVDETADDISELTSNTGNHSSSGTITRCNNRNIATIRSSKLYDDLTTQPREYKSNELLSEKHSVSLGMACSSFSDFKHLINYQVPLISEERAKVYTYQISIKPNRQLFQSFKTMLNRRLWFDKSFRGINFSDLTDSNEMSTIAIKVKVKVPKQRKSKAQIAVVEDIFTKELLQCYSIESAEILVILQEKTNEISVKALYDCESTIQESRICELFSTSVSGMENMSTFFVFGKMKIRIANKRKHNAQNEHNISFKLITSPTYSGSFFSESVHNKPFENGKDFNKQDIINNDTKFQYFRLCRTSPFKLSSPDCHHEEKRRMKTELLNLQLPEVGTEREIPSIKFSIFEENGKISNKYEFSLASSSMSHNFDKETICRSSDRIYKRRKAKHAEITSPNSNSTLSVNKGSNRICTHVPKLIAYSLPEHTYLKYRHDTFRLQRLIANPLLQALRSTENHQSAELSENSNRLEKSNYNDWLLTAFPMGLTHTSNQTLKGFNFKFSLYVTENENCHKLFLEFYQLKSMTLTKSKFQQWCMEKCQYNTIEIYEELLQIASNDVSVESDNVPNEHILKFIASKCNCLVTISDRFRYGEGGTYRAIQFAGGARKSVLTCIKYFLRKII